MAPAFDSCAQVPARLTTELAEGIVADHRSCPPGRCARRTAALYYLLAAAAAEGTGRLGA
ncbi:hypothetical protein [Nocardia stercoris]|uniref:hypothetical protein n=1 Tax=Nocardia stercoris TaxID=2483361 RepID=UPI0011C34342|nr:hypothetical protein [Nocardia stercoris]